MIPDSVSAQEAKYFNIFESILNALKSQGESLEESTLVDALEKLESYRLGEGMKLLTSLAASGNTVAKRVLAHEQLFRGDPAAALNALAGLETDDSFSLVRAEAYERLGQRRNAAGEYARAARFHDEATLAALAAKLFRVENMLEMSHSSLQGFDSEDPGFIIEKGFLALSKGEKVVLPEGFEVDFEEEPVLYYDWVSLKAESLLAEDKLEEAFELLLTASGRVDFWEQVLSLAYELGAFAFKKVTEVASGTVKSEAQTLLAYLEGNEVRPAADFMPYRFAAKLVEDGLVSEAIELLKSNDRTSPLFLGELLVEKGRFKQARELIEQVTPFATSNRENQALLFLALEAFKGKLSFTQCELMAALVYRADLEDAHSARVEGLRRVRSDSLEVYKTLALALSKTVLGKEVLKDALV